MITNKDWYKLKRAHLSTQVLRFGEISLMVISQIYGLLAVSYMKCAAWNLRLMVKIWMNYTKMYKEDKSSPFLVFIQESYKNW
jgi:hypothetical protein